MMGTNAVAEAKRLRLEQLGRANRRTLRKRGLLFDYDNQAWVKDGLYVRCGHPEAMACGCYSRAHEGEPATLGASR